MNIALIGYGKMGRAVEEIALQRKHEIVLRIDQNNLEENTAGNLARADVAVEFTGPETAVDNIIRCFEAGVPVVSGSTGWLDRLEEVQWSCEENNSGFLYASNFSIGVNIFFEINKRLAQLIAPHSEYDVSIEEIHHTQKKDSPSGTAISIAEQIIAINPLKNKWVNGEGRRGELGIISKRIDPAPGTHKVHYHSQVDDIEIIHTAHNRQGFALGAVLAAEFLAGRSGVYSMKDVLAL